MGQIDIDFTDVPDFEPLPKGEYSVIVESVELRDSQSSEHPYLNWALRVSEGEFANRILFMITSLSPKALWRLKPNLQALGITEEQVSFQVDEESNQVLNEEIIGRAAIAMVRQETYEQRIQNRVDGLKPMTQVSEIPSTIQVTPSVAQPALVKKPTTVVQPTVGAKKPALTLK